MPERDIYGGSSKSYEPDTRFGGNLERANTRRDDPPRWASEGRQGGQGIRDVKALQDAEIDAGVAEAVAAQNEAANAAALAEAEKKRKEMKKAMGLAYATQWMGDPDPTSPNYNPDAYSTQVSNLHNLSDSQLQFLIDSGFAASEASGVLGGTMGLELEFNKLKKDLANADTNEEAIQIYNNMSALGVEDPNIYDPYSELYNPDLAYDPSAVYSWDMVEHDDYLNQAHSDLMSSDLTPTQYKNYMKGIGAFGHDFPSVSSPSNASWPFGGGSGGDIAALYGAGLGLGGGSKPKGEEEYIPGQTSLQDYMVEVHRENPYTNLAIVRDGGIIDLVK